MIFINTKQLKINFVKTVKERRIKGLNAYSLRSKCPFCKRASLVSKIRNYYTYPNYIRQVKTVQCVYKDCGYWKLYENMIPKKKNKTNRRK